MQLLEDHALRPNATVMTKCSVMDVNSGKHIYVSGEIGRA